MSRPEVVFDTEIYRNYLLIAFKSLKSGKVVCIESRDGEEIDRDYLKDLLRNHRLIGFNSRPFDIVICWMAALGYSVATLKKVANDIIVRGKKPWDIERQYEFEIPKGLDHIDLIETAPGVGVSLKVYAGRMHAKRLQELPIDPDAVLTDEQMDILKDYCVNSDIPATELLHARLKGQLDLRATMGREYGVDLRSKSEAQVAEAVIRARLEKLTGERVEKVSIKTGTKYRYRVPPYIRYQTPQLQAMLDQVRDAEFVVSDKGSIKMPRALEGKKIRLGGSVYRMGIGGLHSSEESTAHIADSDTLLIDRDVTSYYPNIIITLGLYPKHLGPAFLKVYRKIYDIRVAAKDRVGAAKKAGLTPDPNDVVQNESLKIVLNGSFGKFGNRYSVLYSPDLMIQVTVTGQLALLLLIERIELAGIPVVSANTDGVVIKCPKSREADLQAIIRQWEQDTRFETEEARYQALYSRDVNSYIAVKDGGKVKTKGAFANPWWDKDPDQRGQFMTSPKRTICVEAVIERILNGTPVEKTIRTSRDVTKFVTVQKVTGGAIWAARENQARRNVVTRYGPNYEDEFERVVDLVEGTSLGKVVRFYHSWRGAQIFYAKPHATTGNFKKVAKSEGVMPLMNLPDEFPADVDYDWYAREAREMLELVGFQERRSPLERLIGALI